MDHNGNVYVTGESTGDVGFFEYLTIKYLVVQPVPLNIQPMGSGVVLSWTNANFGLQSAPVATGISTNIPDATSPYTNSSSGMQQFFRLILN